MGCHLWGHTESDTTEATEQQQQQQHYILSMKINPTAPMSCFRQILTEEKSEPSGALSISPDPHHLLFVSSVISVPHKMHHLCGSGNLLI